MLYSIDMATKIPQIRFSTANVPPPHLQLPAPPGPLTSAKAETYLRLTSLSERTIRRKLPKGDTYLHRAVMERMFRALPASLLKDDLFMVANKDGETAIHVAARYGHLDQIPTKFLTRETLVEWDK